MCVAAPGIVEKIEGQIATVNYEGNIVKAHAGIIDVRPGDYVLVHAGMIIQTLKKKEAEELKDLFEELEDL